MAQAQKQADISVTEKTSFKSILSQVFATLATLPSKTSIPPLPDDNSQDSSPPQDGNKTAAKADTETTDQTQSADVTRVPLLSELLPSKLLMEQMDEPTLDPEQTDTTDSEPRTSLLATISAAVAFKSKPAELLPNSHETVTDAVVSASEASAGKTVSGVIKCPTYCRSNCVVQHHPLLVAILNCVDTEEMELMDMKLNVLDCVIKHKSSTTRWQCDDVIPDALQEYRYPMIHWACMLGRVGAAVWLVGHKYSHATGQAMTHLAETGIHKALLNLQATCGTSALKKFVQLLSVMEPALSIRDKDGNTPFHTCAEMLRAKVPEREFFSECLMHMVGEMCTVRSRDDVAMVLNTKNCEGNTILHILVDSPTCGPYVRYLVTKGANPIIANNKGETPVDIAKKGNLQHTLGFLKTGLKYVVESSGPASSIRLVDPDKNSITTTPDLTASTVTNTTATSQHSQNPSGADCEPLAKKPRGEFVTMKGDKITVMGKPEPVETRKKSPPPPPAPPKPRALEPVLLYGTKNLSAEQAAIQKFFDDVTEEGDKEKKSSKFMSAMKTDLRQLLSAKNYEDAASLLRIIFRDKERVTEYLGVLKEGGPEAQTKVIDCLLQKRNTALTHLSYANESIECLQARYRESQKAQATQVTDIMGIVDNLGNLNGEEAKMNEEIDALEAKARTVETTNGHLRERLSNCQQAIQVLKRLHRESALERRRRAATNTTTTMANVHRNLDVS